MSGLWRFSVYVVTCAVSGRIYVGMTGGSVAKRWRFHVQHAAKGAKWGLARGIRKHGAAAFSINEVARCRTEEDAFHIEGLLIAEYRLGGIPLYNMTNGGDGVVTLTEQGMKNKKAALAAYWARPDSSAKHSENIRKWMNDDVKGKIGTGQKNAWADPEKRAKRQADMMGHAVSEETKRKIGDAGRGREVSATTREKLSASGKGKCGLYVRTDDVRKKLSATRTGMKLSREALQKRREGMATRGTRNHPLKHPSSQGGLF